MPKVDHEKDGRDRTGNLNPNWRGGISGIKTTRDIFNATEDVKDNIKARLLRDMKQDESTGCWNWTGITFKKNGRARICLGVSILAARASYVIFKGDVGDLNVLHTCDNVLCINPEHLWLGTHADNSADMVAKGRSATGDRNGSRLYPERLIRGDAHPARIDPTIRQGENNGRALLTAEQVREIRAKYVPYINNHKPSNQRQLAKEYGVGVSVISGIVRGVTWRSV